jgi:hypothetical protein
MIKKAEVLISNRNNTVFKLWKTFKSIFRNHIKITLTSQAFIGGSIASVTARDYLITGQAFPIDHIITFCTFTIVVIIIDFSIYQVFPNNLGAINVTSSIPKIMRLWVIDFERVTVMGIEY